MGKFNRILQLELPAEKSAFLWGPRKVGKSYWITRQLSQAQPFKLIDLLKSDVYAEYASRPALLRERWDASFTIIDEIQKIPSLLNEIHWLIATKMRNFC